MKAELIDVFGSDLMVVNAARVSFNKTKTNLDGNDERLIGYLARHGHWSPFSHPRAQFRLTLPIFVARQWEKHRVGAVRGYDIYDQNEVSRRYVDSEPEIYYPDAWRSRPDGSIKQGSGDVSPINHHIQGIYADAVVTCAKAYRRMIAMDIAPEQARMVLPQSMYTSWIETGSLLYWSRVVTLRTDSHAQQEITVLAQQVAQQMADAFPVSWEKLTHE